MSIFKSRQFQMKNGKNFIVRSAITADALPLLDQLLRLTTEDAHTILTSLEEAENITLVQEETWIQSHLDHPAKLILVAEVDSVVRGVLDISCGGYIRNSHIARIGMGITKEYRGQGVGAALMGCMIEWARGIGSLEKLELQVHTDNLGAIALYKKMGFLHEHTFRKNLKYGPNAYKDSHLMGLWLKP